MELKKHGVEIYTVPIGLYYKNLKELPDPNKRAVYLNAIENIATDDFILKLNEISMHAFNSIYNATLVIQWANLLKE